jgi:hypothetical protein
MKKYFVQLTVVAVILTGIFATCKKEDDKDKDNTNTSVTPPPGGEEPIDSSDYTVEEVQKMNTIKTMYANITKSFTGSYFITTPSITAPYAIGEVKNEILQSGIDAINLMRYIAGIPYDVVADAEYTNLCQHGAVLLAAVDQLTHYPSKPADMDQDFFDKGLKATSSSNIATAPLPYRSVLLYMDDSDPGNIDRVGHRRWILNPSMKKSGFGVVSDKRYSVMYSKDKSRGNVDYDYIAWPPAGVFPRELFDKNYAWSISVNTTKYGTPDINKVTVTLKHLNTGQIWTFSNTTPGSTERLHDYFNVETNGYGISNCIIFRPKMDNLFLYEPGDIFEVTVSGLTQDLTYKVKMFSVVQNPA